MFRPPVRDKQANFNLWTSGAYGNRLHAWPTVAAYRASGFPGRIVLRYLGATGCGLCEYNLYDSEIDAIVEEWRKQGADPDLVMVNEAAPDYAVTLQGELFTGVTPDNRPDYFLYSTVVAHMRPALAARSRVVTGLTTRMLLRQHMTPSSLADLDLLIDNYPDHVLEISVFRICLGDIPGRNSLVWEVRRY